MNMFEPHSIKPSLDYLYSNVAMFDALGYGLLNTKS